MSSTTKTSLRDRLHRYLSNGHGWIASGDLQRLVAEKTTYTPRTVVRRLEELAAEGKLEVQYRTRNGVRHAYYRAIPQESVESLVQRQAQWAGEFNS